MDLEYFDLLLLLILSQVLCVFRVRENGQLVIGLKYSSFKDGVKG